MSELVVNTLWIYGLAAAVSLLIAALIKLIVVLLGRVDRPAAVIAPRTESGRVKSTSG